MGKALIARANASAFVSGRYISPVGNGLSSATEGPAQFGVTDDCTFSNLRANVSSGNSGTATLTLRENGADSALAASGSGLGKFSDTSNSVASTVGDLISLITTDTGTDVTYLAATLNVEFASGHGSYHISSNPGITVVYDVASATRYHCINGTLQSDGTTTEANAESRNRAYDTWGSLQARVVSNARTNTSTIRNRINAADGSGVLSIGAGLTGLFTDIGFDDALADGDDINVSIALGTGTEDLVISLFGATLKSSTGDSDLCSSQQGGYTRFVGAENYVPLGGPLFTGSSVYSAVTPGFAAECRNLRCHVISNSHTGSVTITLYVNGVSSITLTVTAGGTGWFENSSDTVVIDDNDEIAISINGGTANSASYSNVSITLGAYTPPAGGQPYVKRTQFTPGMLGFQNRAA